MFKKLVATTATLAALLTASVMMSSSASADTPWDWRLKHHHWNPGGNNWHPVGGFNHPHYFGLPPGTFMYDRWHGGGPFFFGGPGVYFGNVYDDAYYDQPIYFPHRHCHIKKVRKNHHWVKQRVCRYY